VPFKVVVTVPTSKSRHNVGDVCGPVLPQDLCDIQAVFYGGVASVARTL
jgi:hypothetical protein